MALPVRQRHPQEADGPGQRPATPLCLGLTPPAPGLVAGAHSPLRTVVPEPCTLPCADRRALHHHALRGWRPLPVPGDTTAQLHRVLRVSRVGMTREYTEPSGETTRCVSRMSPGLGSAGAFQTRSAAPAHPFRSPQQVSAAAQTVGLGRQAAELWPGPGELTLRR